jgi:hypothetical protein
LVQAKHEHVFAYTRSLGDKKLLVIANFRGYPVDFKPYKKIKNIIYSNTHRKEGKIVSLQPYEAMIAEL